MYSVKTAQIVGLDVKTWVNDCKNPVNTGFERDSLNGAKVQGPREIPATTGVGRDVAGVETDRGNQDNGANTWFRRDLVNSTETQRLDDDAQPLDGADTTFEELTGSLNPGEAGPESNHGGIMTIDELIAEGGEAMIRFVANAAVVVETPGGAMQRNRVPGSADDIRFPDRC